MKRIRGNPEGNPEGKTGRKKMRHAYDECYLDDAMKNLGEAVEYASIACAVSPDQFMEMMIAGGIAKMVERGVPEYISGMSGTELACEVIRSAGLERDMPAAIVSYDYSPEYWSGWITAYYQWESGLRFRDIIVFLPMQEIVRMYPALHEAPEDRFVYAAENIRKQKKEQSRLQQLRRLNAYSQRMLAERSGVSLRMIQQYEQGTKEISRASASSLLAMADVLGCDVEELLL